MPIKSVDPRTAMAARNILKGLQKHAGKPRAEILQSEDIIQALQDYSKLAMMESNSRMFNIIVGVLKKSFSFNDDQIGKFLSECNKAIDEV